MATNGDNKGDDNYDDLMQEDVLDSSLLEEEEDERDKYTRPKGESGLAFCMNCINFGAATS